MLMGSLPFESWGFKHWGAGTSQRDWIELIKDSSVGARQTKFANHRLHSLSKWCIGKHAPPYKRGVGGTRAIAHSIFHKQSHRKEEGLKVRSTEEYICQSSWLSDLRNLEIKTTPIWAWAMEPRNLGTLKPNEWGSHNKTKLHFMLIRLIGSLPTKVGGSWVN